MESTLLNLLKKMREDNKKEFKEFRENIEKKMDNVVKEMDARTNKRIEGMDKNTDRVEGIKKKEINQEEVVINKENCSFEGPISNYDDPRDFKINLMKGNLADAEVPPSSRLISENTNFNNHILSRNEEMPIEGQCGIGDTSIEEDFKENSTNSGYDREVITDIASKDNNNDLVNNSLVSTSKVEMPDGQCEIGDTSVEDLKEDSPKSRNNIEMVADINLYGESFKEFVSLHETINRVEPGENIALTVYKHRESLNTEALKVKSPHSAKSRGKNQGTMVKLEKMYRLDLILWFIPQVKQLAATSVNCTFYQKKWYEIYNHGIENIRKVNIKILIMFGLNMKNDMGAQNVLYGTADVRNYLRGQVKKKNLICTAGWNIG